MRETFMFLLIGHTFNISVSRYRYANTPYPEYLSA